MNATMRGLIPPVLALVVLALVITQTLSALHGAGAWGTTPKAPPAPAEDPYAHLDRLIAQPAVTPPAGGLRDPFAFGAAPTPARPHPTARRVVPPPPPPQPVLTAIVWAAEPSALLRWNGHDYTVKIGGLFDVFRVVSITREAVVLDRNGVTLVLKRPMKGD